MELKLEQQQLNESTRSRIYARGQFFIDKKGFLNIRISKDELKGVEEVDEIIVRHHENFFMKIFGLPYERVKNRKEGLRNEN